MQENSADLRRLRDKWAKPPPEDVSGVYGVDEAAEEASAEVGTFVKARPVSWDPDAPIGPDFDPPRTNMYGADTRERQAGRSLNDRASRELADQRHGYKTCIVCELPRRNNPCDDCYNMVRAAAEWVDDPGMIVSEETSHPCLMCGLGDIYCEICLSCMVAILGGQQYEKAD